MNNNHQAKPVYIESAMCPLPIRDRGTIILGHGSGGKLSHDLIKERFLPAFDNDVLTAAQAASAVPAANIAFTLVMYLLLYAALLLAYVRVIFHLASKPAKARQDLDPAGVAPPPTREPRGAA